MSLGSPLHPTAWAVPALTVACVVALPSASAMGMMTGFLPAPYVMLYAGFLATGVVVSSRGVGVTMFTPRHGVVIVLSVVAAVGYAIALNDQLVGPFGSYNAERILSVAIAGVAGFSFFAIPSVRTLAHRIVERTEPVFHVIILVDRARHTFGLTGRVHSLCVDGRGAAHGPFRCPVGCRVALGCAGGKATQSVALGMCRKRCIILTHVGLQLGAARGQRSYARLA